MKIWIGVTDSGWFEQLSRLVPDEVNFWQPGGGRWVSRVAQRAQVSRMTAKPDTDLAALQRSLRQFVAERDWDQFHTPLNLAVSLCLEAAELLETFQWMDGERSAHLSPEQRKAAEQECADVLLYLLRMADKLGIDLVRAGMDKLEVNRARYPVEKSRGKSTKYTRL